MKKQLLLTLENSRIYTLAIAKAMPESDFDSKPTEEIWTFRELLHHIAYSVQWYYVNYNKKVKAEWDPPPSMKTKKQVLEYLVDEYDSLKKTISDEAITDNIVKKFYTTVDHITHHRGQAVIHLRCKGITPPEYKH